MRDMMEDKKAVIHIAPSIDYLFNATEAHVLCGRTAQEVFDAGEFIGVAGVMNEACTVCDECRSLGDS